MNLSLRGTVKGDLQIKELKGLIESYTDLEGCGIEYSPKCSGCKYRCDR